MSRPIIGGWGRIFKGKTLGKVIKDGWHENPETVGALAYVVIALVGMVGYIQYSNSLGDERYKYKQRYIVKRVTDVENPDSDLYS